MTKQIAVLAGDGIGQEVMPQALKILSAITEHGLEQFDFQFGEVGGLAYEKTGQHLPEQTKTLCEQSDAILFGSVGGPVSEQHLEKWHNCEANTILALRKMFHFSTNLRPAKVYQALLEHCPLKMKREALQALDLLIIRELNGDVYFGEHKRFVRQGRRVATDLAEYDEDQIAQVTHQAFQAAQKRRKKLTSVDKANVLSTSQLWREVVIEISAQYPDVTLEHMLVDNCAMQLIVNPAQFDVIVTGNLFGDILSDATSVIPGSLGLMASASLGANDFGLYEPSGGSAQDIAGKNVANPIAQILSAGLMLRYSFGMEKEATMIEDAVIATLNEGYVTQDIYSSGKKLVSTQEMTQKILEQVLKLIKIYSY